MFKFLGKLMGDSNERELSKMRPVVEQINDLEPEFEKLTVEQLRDKTVEFKGRLLAGDTLDAILPEAFAAVREAAKRTLGQRHFDVQLMGGMVLHQGKIAEMKTGEGKTLVATLPSYLNALTGKGVHVITVNDYLARRDRSWMGQIHELLGLTVGVIQHGMEPPERKESYACDIIYGTNNEFGFDYLRDNMVWELKDRVHRPLNFAIVDEVDNILVDEARTPLIISGQAEESTDKYTLFSRLVPRLRKEEDYTIDEKVRAVTLTEEGIDKMERWLGLENLFDPAHYDLTRYLDQGLKSQFIFKLDRDYVVKDGEVVIVDEFTGRLMFGRRYSEGLHQAIEAKEGVRIQRESVTLATITFQNYFRLYKKLSGMTGTAVTEAEEFHKIYKLDVVVMPTNRDMVRQDMTDQIFKTEAAKYRAVVGEIEELHKQKRPVLVGTTSIEKSELLSDMLTRKGIPHQVLNAKQHEKEAGIIAQAGKPETVTIATSMAGRGVDIILGGNPGEPEDAELVRFLGGLHVLGTERHEARRIDNQLRGRAGRQGDPGSSRFYLSLEDDLMRRFGGSNIAGIMDRLGLEEDIPLEHGLVSKAVENAQTKVEAHNFDIRKHVVDYDDVMNKQREVIYAERSTLISTDDLKPIIMEMVHKQISEMVDTYLAGDHADDWDAEELLASLKTMLPIPPDLTEERLRQLSREEAREGLLDLAEQVYAQKEQELGEDVMRRAERWVSLNVIDSLWVQHLTAVDDLREGIGLRAYGQRDPLVEYKAEAFNMFQGLLDTIQKDIVQRIFHVRIVVEEPPKPAQNVITNREEGEGPKPVKVANKVGRNDPCPCGSGKKYKKCHGK
ncbi:MAG TPA: preprotein translocase subunit SecA [Chloroflexota bacterium]|nr:preprotein translocase subunit SecA [Chloroflexota bacterium]